MKLNFTSNSTFTDLLHSRCFEQDTVNTASRMESNSLANRIQCSEKSASILAEQDPDIKIIKRGKIAIKGKGEMVRPDGPVREMFKLLDHLGGGEFKIFISIELYWMWLSHNERK